MRSEPQLSEVFTFVVVMQGREARHTLPITVCARPGEAEHAARVIAWLELSVLAGPRDDPELYE